MQQDSDAIYHHFKVKLDGILDAQLVTMAASSQGWHSATRHRPGLHKMILNGVDMDAETKNKWMAAKNNGKALWNPDQDGSCDRFTERNKLAEIIEHCCSDVVHLRTLYWKPIHRLWDSWTEKVKTATIEAIAETFEEDFESSGRWGPWQ
jgi:exonuclease 3'-5' domain-containing protein 1